MTGAGKRRKEKDQIKRLGWESKTDLGSTKKSSRKNFEERGATCSRDDAEKGTSHSIGIREKRGDKIISAVVWQAGHG